jgi:hypothetical protein
VEPEAARRVRGAVNKSRYARHGDTLFVLATAVMVFVGRRYQTRGSATKAIVIWLLVD